MKQRINSTDVIVGVAIFSQPQLTNFTGQTSTDPLPENLSAKKESNSPTDIIIGIAILLMVLRPVMLSQKLPQNQTKKLPLQKEPPSTKKD